MPGALEVEFARVLASLHITRATGVAVALSGGPDSVALLSLARHRFQAASRAQVAPIALIVDHGLRSSSAEEGLQARAIADSLGIQAKILNLSKLKGWPPSKRGELLSLARKLRYQVFYQECVAQNITVLLTGHHAGDQAENFLMRLSRGSGTDGLAGIPESSLLTTGKDEVEVRLVRPLLSFRKEQLEEYCRDKQLPWITDPTNRDTSFVRNLIRQHLAVSVSVPRSSPDPDAASCLATKKQDGQRSNAASKSGAAEVEISSIPAEQHEHVSHADGNLDLRVGRHTAKTLPAADVDEGHKHDIVRDLLRLTQACRDARETLEHRARELVKLAVHEASLNPSVAKQQREPATARLAANQQSETVHRMQCKEGVIPVRQTSEEPVFVHLRPFAASDQSTAIRALALLLQVQSGSDFPPRLATLLRLWQKLKSGRCSKGKGRIIGGSLHFAKCQIQPLQQTDGEIVSIRRC